MRADDAVRHNAAVGTLLGLAVGDTLSQLDELPPQVSTEVIKLPSWGEIAEQSFVHAESTMKGQLLDIDISPTDIVASALSLGATGASPPLLANPSAVLVGGLLCDAMAGELDIASIAPTCETTAAAVDATLRASSFVDAIKPVAKRTPEHLALTGAIAGCVWGPGAIPATWVTTVHGPVGGRTYGLRQLRRLAERLTGFDAPVPPEPRRSLGPREVAPGLWLSNLHAVPRFLAQHPDGAVISLCPTTGAFDNHELRREFAVHDASGRAVNPLLSDVLDDILTTIDRFLDADVPVLVHCHHGASRTGLVLRARLMAELDLSFDDATTEAQVRWPKTSTWNHAFAAELKRRSPS